ncbi:hypothetical protein PN36_04965 [Candidatus Thiomargarita nelsonii]|uniref:Uncharacterized protein n=1 Tax=Candidatus Thiomargarita nelsonii TaxID=1003181 RepID=A0A0A6P5V7_9GAMM|nr:hypothetical protein PN36_04965 [Candidatus Thiomargarita nelsonii]
MFSMHNYGHEQIRRNNLKRIIDEQYQSNQAAFARAIEIKPTQISNMLNGKAPIGNSMAQRIENLVGRERGALDLPPEKIFTAYIYVEIPIPLAGSLLETLHEYESVKEAAVVYGNDWQVFVKLQATEKRIQEIIMQVISPLKGVRGTHTSIVMSGHHWQKEQAAQALEIMPAENPSKLSVNGDDDEEGLTVDEYRSRLTQKKLENPLYTSHLNNMIDNWQEMGKQLEQAFAGQVSITQQDQLLLYPLSLLEKAQSSLYASVVWQQRTAAERGSEQKCFEKQKNIINNKKTDTYKIFVIPNPAALDNDLLMRMYQEMQMGVKVSYLLEDEWKFGETGTSEAFMIFDEQQVWAYLPLQNHQSLRHAVLYTDPNWVKKYLNLFKANQLVAHTLSSEQIERAEKLCR